MIIDSATRRVIYVTGSVIAAIILIVCVFTFNQANEQRLTLSSDLQYRTRVLADSLEQSIRPFLVSNSAPMIRTIIDRIADYERVVGLGVFDNTGAAVATSADLPEEITTDPAITIAMDSDMPSSKFMQISGQNVNVLIEPLHNNDRVIGALAIVQNASYIDTQVGKIWDDNLLRLFLQILLVAAAFFALARWVFFKPLANLAESVRAIRRGDIIAGKTNSNQDFLLPLTSEISKIAHSLRQARSSASEEARMRLEKLDSPWTAERLKEFIKAYLKDRPIFVVSNREPYVHTKVKNSIKWSVPAGGVVTALEPVMKACGGMWIAHGSGDADKETADSEGKVAVPPEEPKYTLKRVWLSQKEIQGYYNGFSNEALWPLCHMAHTRPLFRKEDWLEYRKVNGLFAKTLLAEIRKIERPLVLVQDYHLALLPALIKKSRPDAQVAIFWHIPWPSAAQFNICPWRKELLEGMLGADLIGFHTQQHTNNFMDTIGSEIEARIDFEHFSITHHDHHTYIKPFPISIAFPGNAEPQATPDRSVLEALNIHTEYLAIGVDRLDYTKGILERVKGIEFFLRDNPLYHHRFTFLQIASPTRESVEKYREYAAAVEEEIRRINKEFGTRTWQPIVFEKKHYSHEDLLPLYQLVNFCLITSLHDGMNLVAKEYVAARIDESGVLILSQFAGAARDLKGALLINPYSAENTAEAIRAALTMPITDQRRRMKKMRYSVRDYNIYRWSAELIKTLTQLN